MLGAPQNYLAVIKVVGVGGGGCNAVNRMVDAGLKGVEFIGINTDAQALLGCDADVKLDIGRQLTRGLGPRSDPEGGRLAAEEPPGGSEEGLKGAGMVVNAFKAADEVLLQGVQGITDLITTPGLINTDFADVKMIMTNAGSALMGIGLASGEGRGVNAARAAVSSPLLEAGIEGARGILLSIAGPGDLSLHEVNEACELIAQAAHPDANIIFGTIIDDALGDQVRITVIAAGFDRFDGERRPHERRVVDLRYQEQEEETGPLEELDVRDGELVEDDFDVPSFLNRS